MSQLDSDLVDLLKNLLSENPEERYSLKALKVIYFFNYYYYFYYYNFLLKLNFQKHKWVTINGEFPLPDMHEEALEDIYEFTSNEIYRLNNMYN